MPSFFFYLFIGFVTALLADYGHQLGPLILALIVLFNLVSIAMYWYASRLRRGAREGDEMRPVASRFLLLAPVCYLAGWAVGHWLPVY